MQDVKLLYVGIQIMGGFTAEWESGNSLILTSSKDLLDLIQKLEKVVEHELPVLLFIAGPKGTLTLGVGKPESVLCFDYGESSYWAIGGDGKRPGMEFMGGGHHSEFPGQCLLPMKVAIDAALEFLATCEIPRTVEWEQLC